MKEIKKVMSFGVITKVLCLLGCVYQCFDISMIYFSYNTSTNVRYESQTFVDIPGVTVCYYKLEQISDKLKSEIDKKYGSLGDSKPIFLNNLTLRQQWNELGDKPEKFLSCFYRWNIGTNLNCNSVQNYTKSFDSISYCVTAFSQDDGDQGDEMFQIKTSSNILKTMINFELRKLERRKGVEEDEILVKLHDRKEKIRLDFTRGTLLISQLYKDYTYIKYQKTIVKYLFNPRLKPCFVGQTADECINNCKIKEFIEKTGLFPGKYLFFGENYSDLKFSTFKQFFAFNWSENCLQLCGHNTDCYREYFISDFKEYHYKYINPMKFDLAIEFPTHLTTIYEISLKMSFGEYLCLIASILSLWFGFSILSFIDFIQIIFNRLILQYNCFSIQNPNNLVFVSSINKAKPVRYSRH